jgi:hypothetical protein
VEAAGGEGECAGADRPAGVGMCVRVNVCVCVCVRERLGVFVFERGRMWVSFCEGVGMYVSASASLCIRITPPCVDLSTTVSQFIVTDFFTY